MPENRFFHVTADNSPMALLDRDEALARMAQGGYVWFDYFNPGKEELTVLMAPLGLHPLSIEDCLDDDQVPKIDDFASNNFILFNSYFYAEHSVAIDEVDFFLGKNFLVTVSHGHVCNARPFAGLDTAIERDLENVHKGPDFLLHVILDFIVDEKFKAIEALQEELDNAEEMAIQDPVNFRPQALLHIRKNLLVLRKSLFHEREILVKICRRDSPFISEKVIYHFRDIYDHLTKFFEAIEIYREMITSLMEMYLSVLNNRMTIVANRTNLIVRRLTLITTIFMPLTLLAGIGGMSEWSMMTGPVNWRIAYPAFLLLMGVLGVVNYFILKKFEARDRKGAANISAMSGEDDE